MMTTDKFPRTPWTLIRQMLSAGEAGRQSLHSHLMDLYYEPLTIYCRALSNYKNTVLRFEPPESMVSGFFASRLSRKDYIRDWSTREKPAPLRKWLRGGLILFCKEEITKRNRARRFIPLSESHLQIEAPDPPAEEAYVLACRSKMLQIAWDRARILCQRSGFDLHWSIFKDAFEAHKSRSTIAIERGMSRDKVQDRLNTARKRFRSCLEDVIRDGLSDPTPSQIQAEFESLFGREWDRMAG